MRYGLWFPVPRRVATRRSDDNVAIRRTAVEFRFNVQTARGAPSREGLIGAHRPLTRAPGSIPPLVAAVMNALTTPRQL